MKNIVRKFSQILLSLCLTSILFSCDGNADPQSSLNPQALRIPVVYITTDNLAPVTSKEDYVYASIIVEDVDCMYTSEKYYEGRMRIKGRGNTTWNMPKKPWRLKLDEKHSLLGMPSEKDWCLLANYSDKTLLRNMTAMRLSEICGMSWSPRMRPVEVYMNGNYHGCYTLAEHKEVSEERVSIEVVDETDCSGEALTGGYYLEIDQSMDEKYCFMTPHGIPVMFSDPEIPTDVQYEYIKDLKKLKDAICNMNFTSGSALKLGNVGKFVRGLTYSASDVIDDTMGTAVMRSNNISNGDPANFEELIWVNKTPNHEQILRGGDIIICMANGSSPLVGKASYYIDCGMESATVGAFCGIYRSYNPLTKWLFQSKHYIKHIQRCIQGGNGAIANIYPEDILAISFNIPSGYERVLNVLNSLEEKYLLEQKLLSRYLGVKSYLLSRLFI